MKTKIFALLSLSLILLGCAQQKHKFYSNNLNSDVTYTVDFNQEKYVWENFHITTNIVFEVK